MTDVSITPEDRERLAKTKFGEWFDEFWEKKFGDSFTQAVTQMGGQGSGQGQGQSGQGQGQGAGQNAPGTQQSGQNPERKRSLLETCLSQTFGF